MGYYTIIWYFTVESKLDIFRAGNELNGQLREFLEAYNTVKKKYL